ncbi:MAG: hypothetical protein OEX02_08595 [Cyclobacteriaceae bacterium]|nr:hypothetical protein [Cyclobacteriaceae bacterium]
MVTPLTKLIELLQRNVQTLLIALETARKELRDTKKEIEELKVLMREKEEIIKDFQNKSKITNIVGSIEIGGKDAEELKQRIDRNIQEIDECIAHLSR